MATVRQPTNHPFGPMNFNDETPDFPVLSKSSQKAVKEGKRNPSTASKADDPDWDPFSVVSPEKMKPTQALPPKLNVRIATHEECTAQVKMALDEFDVTSEVSVEGAIYVSKSTAVSSEDFHRTL